MKRGIGASCPAPRAATGKNVIFPLQPPPAAAGTSLCLEWCSTANVSSFGVARSAMEN
jgi:hypothetical protein